MKFKLTIEAEDNDAVQSRQDVAWLLDGIARKLRSNTQVMSAQIFDTADIVVGFWAIQEPDDTPIYGVPITETRPLALTPPLMLGPEDYPGREPDLDRVRQDATGEVPQVEIEDEEA